MTYDLIIIGADAAGLTAAIYAGRKKINALVLTEKVGGQSVYTDNIENYPGFLEISGLELVARIKKQVQKFGVPIEEGEKVVSIEKKDDRFIIQTDEASHYETRAIVIATGGRWRKLNVPGEEQFIGKGVSFCAICDAPFYKGKDVAVVGGGNTAFESACDLLKYANKIYLLQHRDKFIGDKDRQEKLEISGKVEFLTSAETREIKGRNFVESLVYEDLTTGEMKELKVGGIFINIGQVPNSSFAEGLLELNDRKEIVIDKATNQTSLSGIFAAGDVSDIKYKQSVIAAAEGTKAALSACDYLKRIKDK
jgi:thioredoxin-disulfide reductase